jgi:hypothetical protein
MVVLSTLHRKEVAVVAAAQLVPQEMVRLAVHPPIAMVRAVAVAVAQMVDHQRLAQQALAAIAKAGMVVQAPGARAVARALQERPQVILQMVVMQPQELAVVVAGQGVPARLRLVMAA